MSAARNTVNNAGPSSGINTRLKVCHDPAPHMRAASSRDASSWRSTGASKMVMIGIVVAVK